MIPYLKQKEDISAEQKALALNRFSLETTKALKTQEGDASPSGIPNSFLNHTTRANKPRCNNLLTQMLIKT
jgi:hypothetical protein